MRKTFVCSLIHMGVLGGGLYLDEQAVTFKTNKLTVDKKYRNLVLPLEQIRELSWQGIVATFHMADGEAYRFLIFNKPRFSKHYGECSGK